MDGIINELPGTAGRNQEHNATKLRDSIDHLFTLITLGDVLGVPMIPPYYSLKLLPFVVPLTSAWKQRMHNKNDLKDK